MDKTTRFTLIATALLGILLYTVLRFAADLENAARPPEDVATPVQQAPTPVPTRDDEQTPTPDAGLRRLADHAALVEFLDDKGLNGHLLVDQSAAWYADRGYLGVNEMLGVTTDTARATYYDTFDDATLRAMSEGGDAAATQILARRTMFRNPLGALELYRRAAGQGSVYAVVKIADTLSLFGGIPYSGNDPSLDELGNLSELERTTAAGNFNTEAYATMLAAISDGGPPVTNAANLNWVAALEESVPPNKLVYACERSADIVLAHGRARSANGVAPLSMHPPPVFFSPTDRESRMPCSATGAPVVSMMKLDDCSVERVVDATDREVDLYICAR